MKKGWISNRLGAITTKIGSGATPRGGEESYKETGTPLIRSMNVHDWGFKDAKLARIDDTQAAQLSNVVVEPEDVLLNITGASVARCCVAPAEFLPARVNQHVSIIRPRKDEISPLFLQYLLISQTYKDRLLHTGEAGSTRQAITKAQIEDFVVEYPKSLTEQQRIVGILDEAFAGLATAKANAERNLQNARALFESHLQSVFSQRGEGWVEKDFEEVVSTDCSLSYGIVQPGQEQADGLPIVRPTDLTQRRIHLDGLKRIESTLADGYKRTTLQGTELLLCVRGSTGVISQATPELAGGNVTRGIVPIRFDGSLIAQDFGYFLMTSEAIQSQIRAKTYGAALMQINIRDVRKLRLSFPPLAQQSSMTTKLEELASEIQRLTALYTRKLAALEELKKALLHQAFSGEL